MESLLLSSQLMVAYLDVIPQAWFTLIRRIVVLKRIYLEKLFCFTFKMIRWLRFVMSNQNGKIDSIYIRIKIILLVLLEKCRFRLIETKKIKQKFLIFIMIFPQISEILNKIKIVFLLEEAMMKLFLHKF